MPQTKDSLPIPILSKTELKLEPFFNLLVAMKNS